MTATIQISKFKFIMKLSLYHADIFILICAGVALRSIVSLHSYSGAGKPPMFGDYEAQRHWQEITINLPALDWYRNTTNNDLLYWGLDYPPLTAYHSLIMGKIGRGINDSFVELHQSRGIESESHKTYMRSTVLVADILVYVPAVLILSLTLKSALHVPVIPSLTLFLLYPGQVLIDNGHFQYNNISLGLAAIAIACILKDHLYLASFFFSLALNYKQMELYHALPFFVYIFRFCLKDKSFTGAFIKLSKVGCVVLLTFGVLWLPWLTSSNSFLSVVHRLFPFSRGVFEDKVANFWCAVNVVYKLKDRIVNQKMALICLATTLASVMPINGHLFFKAEKTKFLFALTATAMSFFLFSFQVHEKSILLVTLPAICLHGVAPLEVFWFLEITTFSMLPLLLKDELLLAYVTMCVIFHIVGRTVLDKSANTEYKQQFLSLRTLYRLSLFGCILITFMSCTLPPPVKYPFLWPLLNSLYSCAHFVLFLLFCVWHQFT